MPDIRLPSSDGTTETKSLPPPPVDHYEAGRNIWTNVCSGCHGLDGKRNPQHDVSEAWRTRTYDDIVAFIMDAPGIMNGVYPSSVTTVEEVNAVARFVADKMPPPPEQPFAAQK